MILAIRKNVEEMPPFHFSEMNAITPDGFEMPYPGRPYCIWRIRLLDVVSGLFEA